MNKILSTREEISNVLKRTPPTARPIKIVLSPKSHIQVPNSESKVQSPKRKRKGTVTGADNIILQATTTTNKFSHLKCQSSVRKKTSKAFHDQDHEHVINSS